jgi:hypothetical protein
MLQADYDYALSEKSKLVAGVQYIYQHAIKNGGNEDPGKTYFQKNGKAQTFGARIGWEDKRWETSLNYTRITKDGRYLMPREWGRDPFYTFLPRERNDGFGDVHTYTIKVGCHLPKANLKLQTGFGYYDLPEVTNYALNKYGMPSYRQFNIEVRYAFKGFLEGMDSQCLYVYKAGTGNTYNDDKFVINKVNMSNWNFVLSYHF